uniref:Si:ch1073-44g3.1 n=1 Tax=Kryptolebias marmoratus TaxID=37003 RepID=A0A3Q2ZUQ9_KRYMA
MMHRVNNSSDYCVSGLAEDSHPASHFDLCSPQSDKFYASPGLHKAVACQLQDSQNDLQPPAARIRATEAAGSKRKKGDVKSGRRGRPSGTTKLAGYRTSTGRPLGTTRAAGFKTSPGRPLGTTRAAGYRVSPGRPPGRWGACNSQADCAHM